MPRHKMLVYLSVHKGIFKSLTTIYIMVIMIIICAYTALFKTTLQNAKNNNRMPSHTKLRSTYKHKIIKNDDKSYG